MSTIDLTQVSGLRAVDAEGNDLGTVSLQDLTDSITTQVLQTISLRQQAATLEEPALLSASAQSAGSDTYENQLPQQSDLKWARALDASGNPILISKEDLAGVVGALLKNKDFALSIGSFWDFGTIYDLNDARSSGHYVGEVGKTANLPINDTCLVVVNANNIYAIQTVYALNSDAVYKRRILKYIDKIYDWQKLH